MGTIELLSRIVLVFCIVYCKKSVEGWLNSGIPRVKQEGIQCAFDPCGVPGFCGEGRTCDIDDNCMHECICDDDSKHEKCVGVSLLTTTPKQVKCTFNPCSSPSFGCGEGRQCVLGEFCRPECQCLDNQTHPLCVGDTTDSTDSTKKDSEEYVCIAGESTCFHGTCAHELHGFTCVCEKGWEGVACNISQCTKECHDDSYCHFVTWEVQICLSSSKPSSSKPKDEEVDEPEIHENVCNEKYKIRTKQEHNCTSGIHCIYGICEFNGEIETCVCDKGAIGVGCDQTCCMDCGEFGSCGYIDDVGETCLCDNNQTGINCSSYEYNFLNETQTLAEDPTWHYWVIGACAFALLLLICLMVIVPYCLWKHRVILVMKVVHYFQDYEDNDDRQWDVFISYKSTTSDETFVVETLFPKLEKELGFKANVHFRDFVAGETISNNIISAVEGSRRTILVISPSYVTSEFTKFEYQVAQQEMLKRKHRIIPILLEDITDCKETMDPTLKVILGSVTYIEWPKIDSEKKLDKFWKRIELSMPKKKNRAVEMDLSPVSNGIHNSTTPSSKQPDISSNTKSKYAVTDGNVYSVIDESKLNNEEIYDTLNESEMFTQVMKRQTEAEKKSKEGELLNVLKIDL